MPATLLVKAFGNEGAKALLEQVNRAQDLTANQMDALQKANPQELARFLEGEQPQTIALILAYLEPKPASALADAAAGGGAGGSGEAAGAVAQLLSRDGAEGVAGAAEAAAVAWASRSRRVFPGFKSAADLMNRLEPEAMKSVLDSIEAGDAKLALNIRNLMFTYDDLLGVPESGIRELVARLDKKVLTLALQGLVGGDAEPPDESDFARA